MKKRVLTIPTSINPKVYVIVRFAYFDVTVEHVWDFTTDKHLEDLGSVKYPFNDSRILLQIFRSVQREVAISIIK